MLKSLHIHNYAIIDQIVIDFSSRLNVITGETGAGKSILMGALSLILGDRADTSVLLNRDKKCIVEGVFEPGPLTPLKQLLEANDLDAEDGVLELVIRREIAVNGKSRAFINDTPVNLDLLKQVSSLLVDLHRQFDTLSLSDTQFQRNVLDALAGNASNLSGYQRLYQQWRRSNEELKALQETKTSFIKEYDYHRFLFDELEEAAFTEHELEEAEAELKLLSHSEGIKNALTQVSDMMSYGDQTLIQQLRAIQHQLSGFASYHTGLEDLLKRLHATQVELQDIAGEVDILNDRIQYDPLRIDQLNERMGIGYKLLKKHGVKTTGELLAVRSDLSAKLEAVLNIDEEIRKKEEEVNQMHGTLTALASTISAKRKKQVKPLQEKVNALLAQVGMPNARISVSIENKLPDDSGMDAIEFLFDANKSNRFEMLRKVASGGELSRLMLSIKSLVAESMDMPTLIFDEIDTGISGEAAKQVGIIMNNLARNRQLITITHQPQIAGRADAHLFVYKDMKQEKMRTNIRLLTGEERIVAIAQMLSGEKPTAAALENAREMVMN